MKKYNEKSTQYAKQLRKNATRWERKLWYEFLKDYATRFTRQKPLGNYIADFYCAKAKLVIELDGGGHFDNDTMSYDSQRTADLQSTGLFVLRINNDEIDKNFDNVCEYIDMQVKARLK